MKDEEPIVGFAPYELVEGVISKLPDKSDAIWNDIQEIKRIVKEVREELKPLFKRADMSQVPHMKIGAIDGSNSPIFPRMGWCFGTYAAVCCYNFPKKMEIDADSIVIPNLTGLPRYVTFLRFKKELEMIKRASSDVDLLLFDGSYIPIFWAYREIELREFEGFGDYPAFKDIYEKVIKSKDSLYKAEVFPVLRDKAVISIPEASFSKYFIKKKLGYFDVPHSFSDQVLLTVVLEGGEYTEPIPYYETLSKHDRERADRVHKEMNEFYLGYFKPSKNAPAIKMEFHKNHLDKYDDIVRVLMDHYDPLTKQIHPLWVAHCVSNMVAALGDQSAEITKKSVVDRVADGDLKTLEFIEYSFLPSHVAKTLR